MFLSSFVLAAALTTSPASSSEKTISDVPDLRLEEGKWVRITQGTWLHEGKVVRSADDTTLTLASGPSKPSAIPWKEVDRVELRRSYLPHGAVLGGLATGALGYAVGHALSKYSENSDGTGDVGAGLLIGSVFAIPGSALGALLGYALPRWSELFERPGATPVSEASLVAGASHRPRRVELDVAGVVNVPLSTQSVNGPVQDLSAFGGARMTLLALIGPYVRLGLDADALRLGSHRSPFVFYEQPGNVRRVDLEEVPGRWRWKAGPLARLQWPVGSVSPGLLVGAHLGPHAAALFGGASLGWDLGPGLPELYAEGRYERSSWDLPHGEARSDDFNLRSLSGAVGTRIYW